MKLSKTELKILEQAAKGNKTIKNIAKALKKSEKQIYISTRQLTKKNLITRKRSIVEPNKVPHVTLLLQLISTTPNLTPLLANSGIPILAALPATIKEITKRTKIKRAMVYRKLNEAKKRSVIKKTDSKFHINKKLWCKLNDFLKELETHEQLTDERVPASSTIYYKNNNKIIFSCKETLDATKTAFSAYEKYGIKLLLTTNYYCLPKKELTKKQVLKHSLYILEKDWSIRKVIFLALFYIKFKKFPKVNHKILKALAKVLDHEKIEGYPTYKEIEDRAKVYNIK